MRLNTMTMRATLIACFCTASVVAHAHADTAKSVNVQAGDLSLAIEALAKQCGVYIIYPSEQLKGLSTRGVSGTFETKEAFKKLIEGTPLILSEEGSALLISLPRNSGASTPTAPSTATADSNHALAQQSEGSQQAKGGQRKSFWDRFRLAQSPAAEGPAGEALSSSESNSSATGDAGRLQVQEVVVTDSFLSESVQSVGSSLYLV
jgi:hypothetical protein